MSLRPPSSQAAREQALALEAAGEYDQALRAYRALAVRKPWQAGLENAIGRVLACQGQAAEALQCFERVLAREPRNPDALYNRGNALRLLMRREEAIEAYRAVLPLHAEYARLALLEIARQQQALADVEGARVSYLQLNMVAPADLATVGYRLAHESRAWPPDPERAAQLAGELGARWLAQQPLNPLPPPSPRAADRRLRVGLVSADLYHHPVGRFCLALLESAAAGEVDWFVYSNRDSAMDAVGEALRARTQGWRQVESWTDARLAQQVRDDGVDVLVDLSGYTAGHRLAAFALRPAPLQLSWLGYWGTTGLPFIDAVIADWHCVPPGEERFFTEPLLRLPHTRLCYSPPPEAPPLAPGPAMRNGVCTFGCFQQIGKIGPQVLAAWARIAQAVPEARWIIHLGDGESDASDWARLRARGAAAGFAPDQLRIAGRLPYEQYLAAHAEVDVMLDSFPYPGGTTTADALWMGVPTLTLSSPGMLGRQGEQILRTSGLPEWVTHSVDEYVARAIELARSAPTARWSVLRPALRERLRGMPFFDGERFGRDWIDAVRGLWQQKTAQALPARPPQRRLLFYVPSLDQPFGGVKVIYEMVAALNRLGFRAFTHTPPGSRAGAFWDVQKHELQAWNPGPGDVVVAPEVMPADWLRALKVQGVPVWLFVQNWAYVGASFGAPGGLGDLPFDGALVVSDSTEQVVRRCFPQLPRHCLPCALPSPAQALPTRTAIAYMPRKQPQIAGFLRATWPLAFPDLADAEWVEIDGLPHAQVLERLQQARYFVSLQHMEGLGLPALEAMAAGCLVVGFAGVGGQDYARPDNGFWVPDGDGLALLDTLGAVVRRERGEPGACDAMRRAGQQMAGRYSEEARDTRLEAVFGSLVAQSPGAQERVA